MITSLFIAILVLCSVFNVGMLSTKVQQTFRDYQHFSHHKEDTTSIALHLSFSKNTLTLIKEKPLLGYGTGSFKTVYYNRFGRPSVWGGAETPAKVGNPENTYLNIAFQLGVVGLCLYLYILFQLYRNAGCLINTGNREGLEYQSMLVVFMVASVADSFIQLSVGGFFFMWLSSLIITAYQQRK